MAWKRGFGCGGISGKKIVYGGEIVVFFGVWLTGGCLDVGWFLV